MLSSTLFHELNAGLFSFGMAAGVSQQREPSLLLLLLLGMLLFVLRIKEPRRDRNQTSFAGELQNLMEALDDEMFYQLSITPLHVNPGPDLHQGIVVIVGEAVSNMVRHAKAERAEVRLDFLAEHLQLFIQDDGIGFDGQCTRWGKGLKKIKAQVNSLRGTLEVDTASGEGCALWIYIPLE